MKRRALFLFLWVGLSPVFAESEVSVSLSQVCRTKIDIEALPRERQRVFRTYRNRVKTHPRMEELFPETQVFSILANEEMPRYAENLERMLARFSRIGGGFDARLRRSLRLTLENQISFSTFQSRFDDLMAEKPGAVMRALGDNSLEDMNLWLHGGNPLKPTSDSLLGMYLAETGARTFAVQFNVHGTRRWGPERLVVNVSQDSFAAFLKYFQREEFLTIVAHAQLNHNHRVKGIRFSDFRLPHVNSVLPYVVLKTTEGQRLTQYFNLYEKLGPNHWNHIAAQPWLLPGYAKQGGYVCCTQWIGNMPLGDERVDYYAFPNRDRPSSPIRGKFGKYEHDDPLVKRVWKTPGNQSFSELLDQGAANLRGEFASTGWVYETLLGPTRIDRVPVVFRITEDHTQRFKEDFPMNYEAPN